LGANGRFTTNLERNSLDLHKPLQWLKCLLVATWFLVAKRLVIENFWLPYVWWPKLGFLISVAICKVIKKIQSPIVDDRNPFSITSYRYFLLLATKFWVTFSCVMCKVQRKISKNVLTYNMPLFQIQSLAIEKFDLPSNIWDFFNDNRNKILVTICQMIEIFWSPTIWWPKPFLGH